MPKRILVFALVFFLASCNQENTPAPKASFKLEAVSDSYTFGKAGLEVAVGEGVLQNDTYPENVTLSLSQAPEHGVLELKPDGSFSYLAGSSSEDSFRYTLTSGQVKASALVQLTRQTSPTSPDNPEEPAKPDEPSDPTEPTNPDNPTDPEQPSEPVNPDPIDPAPASLCPSTVKTGEAFECQLNAGDTLTNAPSGMVINERSGLVRWTPTAHQAADYKVGVGTGKSFDLTVLPGLADLEGIYVAPDGDDEGAGTAAEPYKTLQHAVDKVKAGTTIFVRGGSYYHPEFGRPFDGTRSANAIAKITVSGTKTAPITLRAHGNEFVKLITDEDGLIFVEVNYWTIEGLELSGSTQSLGYQDAMATWWADDDSLTTGRGISNRRSQHVTVRNCVIHDFPGAGVGSNGADYVTVENNIIYNNGWWSTAGTHGVANSYLTTTDPASGNDEKLILEGNLVFGNQSLIISHVFSKGKVALTVDEGNGLHAQNNRGTLLGKARVENNLLLFNGKAGFGINTMDDITVRNNSFYQNARVVSGAGELTVQSSTPALVVDNLFVPRAERSTIKDFQKSYANVGANVTSGATLDKDLPASVQQLSQVFRDPENLDFRPATGVPTSMGVPEAELTRMFKQVQAYGVDVVSPEQIVDTAYLRSMKQTLFDTWPAKYNNLVLEDKETGYDYTYAQRCHYPGVPSDSVCTN